MEQLFMDETTPHNRIRLLLLDDFGLFRSSLGRLLAAEPDLAVEGECATCAEALNALRAATVDLILLDFAVGSENGCDFISAARDAGYRGRFLIVAGSADVRSSAVVLNQGASGVFLKSDTADHLVQAIRFAGNGGIWIDPGILRLLAERLIDLHAHSAEQNFAAPLEDRERMVLAGIVQGLTNRKIGDRMGITEGSVKGVVQRLFNKAGVKTRGQLVRAALEGELRLDEDTAGAAQSVAPDRTPG